MLLGSRETPGRLLRVELTNYLRPGRFLLTGSTRYSSLPTAAQSLAGQPLVRRLPRPLAVNAHGHVRSTRDVDILIEWSAENMQRLAAALGDLDAKLFGVDADPLDVDPCNPEDLLNGGNFTLRTAAGGLDLFDPSEIPGGRPYEEMRPRAVEAVVEGVSVRAVGFDDLIRLKRESGRDRDLEDVATLLAAERTIRR